MKTLVIHLKRSEETLLRKGTSRSTPGARPSWPLEYIRRVTVIQQKL